MNDLDRAREALRLYGEVAIRAIDPPQGEILTLVRQGVDVHQTGDEGWSLLHYANSYGHPDICKLLLGQGANIHARDRDGQTPLQLAVLMTDVQLSALLLEKGANIWAKDRFGRIVSSNDFDNKLIHPHQELWLEILDSVKNKNCHDIESPLDLYYLASVMKPSNPKNVPPPKEFIRILFQQYLPHEPKLDAMYAEIFSQQRINVVEDLQALRQKAAARGRGVVL